MLHERARYDADPREWHVPIQRLYLNLYALQSRSKTDNNNKDDDDSERTQTKRADEAGNELSRRHMRRTRATNGCVALNCVYDRLLLWYDGAGAFGFVGCAYCAVVGAPSTNICIFRTYGVS